LHGRQTASAIDHWNKITVSSPRPLVLSW